MSVAEKNIPWRERAFLSVEDAGAVLGRSPDWVRSSAAMEELDAFRIAPGSPIVIGTKSVQRLIDKAKPVVPSMPRRSGLRLVVNND